MAKKTKRKRKTGLSRFKELVISDAKALFDVAVDQRVNKSAACLYWSTCLIAAAEMRGYTSLMMQAGSASFQRVPDEMDDGVINTHFSYIFEPDSPMSMAAFAMGFLPEMHCWVADRNTREIADMTTGFQPEQCMEMTGEEWHTPNPPKHVWGTWQHIQKRLPGARYTPTMEATMLANRYAKMWLDGPGVFEKIQNFHRRRRAS